MKKNYLGLFTCMLVMAACQKEQSMHPIVADQSQAVNSTSATQITIPITAASFPKELIDAKKGVIEFWAKLPGYSGSLSVGGADAHFFVLQDGISDWFMGFNANDGAGNGGLIGSVGRVCRCGTGLYGGTWTYEKVFNGSKVQKWHHYKMVWRRNGIKGNEQQKVEIFVDGALNSTRWANLYEKIIDPPTAGTINLITTDNPPSEPNDEIIMDELKIYNSKNELVLWNSLDSQYEIEHSNVGPNGSFNGGGNAHFVSGKAGNALAAVPVYGGQ